MDEISSVFDVEVKVKDDRSYLCVSVDDLARDKNALDDIFRVTLVMCRCSRVNGCCFSVALDSLGEEAAGVKMATGLADVNRMLRALREH